MTGVPTNINRISANTEAVTLILIHHFDIDLAKPPYNMKPIKIYKETHEVHAVGDHIKHLYLYDKASFVKYDTFNI